MEGPLYVMYLGSIVCNIHSITKSGITTYYQIPVTKQC